MGKMTFPVPVARAQTQTTAQGLIAQNHDRSASGNTFLLVGGSAYAMLVGLRAGDTITNGYVQCTTAGTGTSLFKLGIYSLDGTTKYASSADQSALFGTASVKTIPLSASWTAPADGGYYVVVVSTAATTLPTLLRAAGSPTGSQIGTNAFPIARGGTGLSDLPAVTVSWVDTASVGLWVGLG